VANPRIHTPERDPGVHRNAAPARSLVEELGDVADGMRQLFTDFGLRPYEVFAVVVRWSGGERHRGTPHVISERPFLPTPKVENIATLNHELRAAGQVRRGEVRLSEISPRYTSDDIERLFPRELAAGEELFIEVRVDARDGQTRRDRYVVAGVPERRAARFDWTVDLRKQDENRERDGRAR